MKEYVCSVLCIVHTDNTISEIIIDG